MDNIKQKLEAEAHQLVDAQRSGGGDIHDLIAKHAGAAGYGEEQVKSLTWLVNRHAFKTAMLVDKKDELDVANAEAVLFKLRGATKSASAQPAPDSRMGLLGGGVAFADGQSFAKKASIDYGPTLVTKLASREMELEGQAKLCSARMRSGLEEMHRLADSVKRAGLDTSEVFYASCMEPLPVERRDVIEAIFTHSKTASVNFTEGQFRMYAQRALADMAQLVEKAGSFVEDMAKLGEAQSRLARVREQKREMRAGLEV